MAARTTFTADGRQFVRRLAPSSDRIELTLTNPVPPPAPPLASNFDERTGRTTRRRAGHAARP
jgi:hypothetical protein